MLTVFSSFFATANNRPQRPDSPNKRERRPSRFDDQVNIKKIFQSKLLEMCFLILTQQNE